MNIKELFLTQAPARKILLHPEYLSETYIPEKLLFREEEIAEITRHAADFLFNKIHNNLIIHGQTGVGKTVAVRQIVKYYNEIAQERGIDSRAIYVSAKDLTYRQALVELAKALGVPVKMGFSIAEIYNLIADYLATTQVHFMIVLDEIDKMKKRHGEQPLDDLIYSLTRLNERVEKIAVMNIFVTNNARIIEQLSSPTYSSLSPIFIYFRNYNADELYEILKDRVEKAFVPGAVDDAALRLLAALIKRESRDLRWAFTVLREAAAGVTEGKITEDVIWKAVGVVERNVLQKIIGGLDVDAIIVLYALAELSMKISTIDSSRLYLHYKELCA